MNAIHVWRVRNLGNVHGQAGAEKHYYTVYAKNATSPCEGLEVYTPVYSSRGLEGYIPDGKLAFDVEGWHVN